MVEIECPNCNARYQVPAQALGPRGRDVTCSSCGNVWLAVPVADAPAPIEASALGVQTRAPQRTEQMTEIRQMLDEVQSNDQRRGPSGPASTQGWGVTADPIAPPSPRSDVREAVFGHAARPEDEDEDFLRSRMGVGGQSGRMKATRGGSGDGPGQRKRLMSKHRRRNRKFEAEKRRGTGAGMTGFVFVLLVSGTLGGIYALAEPIAAAKPETAPALRNYVTAVDQMRAALNEQLGGLRATIEEKLEGDEGAAAQ